MRKIEKAEREGTSLDVTDEERAEYEESRDSLRETMAGLREALTPSYKAMFQRLSGIAHVPRSEVRSNATDPTRNTAVTNAIRQKAQIRVPHGGPKPRNPWTALRTRSGRNTGAKSGIARTSKSQHRLCGTCLQPWMHKLSLRKPVTKSKEGGRKELLDSAGVTRSCCSGGRSTIRPEAIKGWKWARPL